MSAIQNQILDSKKVAQKIRRIAFEIYEQNFAETEIALIGIAPMGLQFAQMLAKELSEVAPQKVLLGKIDLTKHTETQCEVAVDLPLESLQNKVVILADDVLNTGRTLAYSLKPFLSLSIKKLQVAVLVDRSHKSYPISADYVGYSLSTTVNEHVQVEQTDNGLEVYLNE